MARTVTCTSVCTGRHAAKPCPGPPPHIGFLRHDGSRRRGSPFHFVIPINPDMSCRGMAAWYTQAHCKHCPWKSPVSRDVDRQENRRTAHRILYPGHETELVALAEDA